MTNQKRPMILGHRGASFGRVDNSREAFESIAPEGGDGAELDVRATSDGVLAVIHDPVIRGYGAVAEHSFEEISKAMGGGLLRLSDALEILNGQFVDIEIKSDPKEVGWVPSELTSRLLAKELSNYGGSSRLMVSSFSIRALEVFSNLAPDFPIGLLTSIGSDTVALCHAATEMGANYILPHHSSLDGQVLKDAHELGLGVIAWTVDLNERVSTLAKLGIDGIITNKVEAAVAVLSGAA